MKKPPKVPRWELRNGITQCLSIVAMRLGEAEALLAGGFPTQATIVFTFAVEEFGKAVLLRRAFEQSRETDTTVVIDGFYDHTAKLDAAATEIPEESLRVGRRAFPPGAAATVPTDASADEWSVRLDASFVQWVPQALDGLEGRWHWGVKTDLDVLANSIHGVQASLSRAMVEWT